MPTKACVINSLHAMFHKNLANCVLIQNIEIATTDTNNRKLHDEFLVFCPPYILIALNSFIILIT